LTDQLARELKAVSSSRAIFLNSNATNALTQQPNSQANEQYHVTCDRLLDFKLAGVTVVEGPGYSGHGSIETTCSLSGVHGVYEFHAADR
jgi:hypothetical protein